MLSAIIWTVHFVCTVSLSWHGGTPYLEQQMHCEK